MEEIAGRDSQGGFGVAATATNATPAAEAVPLSTTAPAAPCFDDDAGAVGRDREIAIGREGLAAARAANV